MMLKHRTGATPVTGRESKMSVKGRADFPNHCRVMNSINSDVAIAILKSESTFCKATVSVTATSECAILFSNMETFHIAMQSCSRYSAVYPGTLICIRFCVSRCTAATAIVKLGSCYLQSPNNDAENLNG